MYNFSSHTLNGLAVNYSTIPNFALDTVETDARLTPAEKLIYIRLLRYATLIRKVNFKITASWLSDNLMLDRKTVSRCLKGLKEHGYVNDDGIVMIAGASLDTPVTLVNDMPIRQTQQPQPHRKEQANNAHFDDADVAQSSINAIHAMLGIRRKAPVVTTEKEESTTVDNGTKCHNQHENHGTKCHILENANGNYAPLDGTNCPPEWDKMSHSIKNKGKNKEKNNCTSGQNQKANDNGLGFDHLAKVSNDFKRDSRSNLFSVSTNTRGKVSFSLNQTANHYQTPTQGNNR